MTCILQLNNVKYIIADETNLMNFQAFIMTWTNHDLNNLSNWLNAKKIISKTELVIFSRPEKTTKSWTKNKA